MRSKPRRIAVAAASSLILTAGAAIAGATPAAAVDGGCYRGGNNGWNILACISTAGQYMFPDFYVDAKGSPALCTISMYVQPQTTFVERWVKNYPCTLGHHGPQGVNLPVGVKYRTVVRATGSEPVFSKWVWR
ncbi:hypothetical protein ACIBSW_40415 [Actinoplanes sp. NPDC049668]|uniref:hypothetical protein n=1 Tax=unclassified Actinoplanes TaxID=2626549 RepID=UPI0033BCA219